MQKFDYDEHKKRMLEIIRKQKSPMPRQNILQDLLARAKNKPAVSSEIKGI